MGIQVADSACNSIEWKYGQSEWKSEIQNGNGSLEWSSEMDPSGPSRGSHLRTACGSVCDRDQKF